VGAAHGEPHLWSMHPHARVHHEPAPCTMAQSRTKTATWVILGTTRVRAERPNLAQTGPDPGPSEPSTRPGQWLTVDR
jgi:hypothetical protein